MSIARAACVVSMLTACAAVQPVGPRLGKEVPAALVAARGTTIYADGRGLPAGRGSVEAGRALYRDQCARCHGAAGEGGSGGHLVGRGPLTGPEADKTVGNYWPFATTLFDFTRRAMPMDKPGSLSADETYAVTAFVLFLNGIVDGQAVLDANSLAAVRMPNRDGFVWIDAEATR